MSENLKKSSTFQQDDLRVDLLKKMCRLLEIERRQFLDDVWKRHYAKFVTQQQFVHIMSVRFSLPCNLGKIMKITGLTSAGASIFVDKMVKSGVFLRIDDPSAYSEETGAATERWSVVSTDALVAKPVLASVDETGVEYIIFTYENGDAVVTASSEAANVTDTFTVEAREGTLLLNAHSTGAYEPPAPVSEKEWNALLAETAESLAASRLDGTQLSPDAADIPAEPDTETEEQTEPEPGQPETSSVPYVMP